MIHQIQRAALGPHQVRLLPSPEHTRGQSSHTKVAVASTAGKSPAVEEDLLANLDTYLSGQPADFGTIKPDALKEQLAAAKPFILDVREVPEITSLGTIEGAVNIPLRTLAKNLDKLPARDQPIVTVCASGHRSAMAMAALQMLGYTNVKSLVHGFNGWKDAHLPVAAAAPSPAGGTKEVLHGRG